MTQSHSEPSSNCLRALAFKRYFEEDHPYFKVTKLISYNSVCWTVPTTPSLPKTEQITEHSKNRKIARQNIIIKKKYATNERKKGCTITERIIRE